MSESKEKWWRASKGKVHSRVLEYVQRVEQEQFDHYDRFVKLAALYDPNSMWNESARTQNSLTENVIASNADTVSAIIAAVSLRARVMTDDGDWDQQRTARAQEFYAAGLEKVYDVESKAVAAYGHGPPLRGTAAMYINVECPVYDKTGKLIDGKICVESVLADDIIVPDVECRQSPPRPRQIHRRKLVDKDELKAQFPDKATEIDKAQGSATGTRWTSWAGYRPLMENEIVVIHSHFLGLGEKGKPGYVAGRETITIDGCDLLDVPWEQDYLPYARIVWSERARSWYGISLAERIVGQQQVINNSNYQIDRLINLNAIPTTYVSYADVASLTMKVSRPGLVVGLKGGQPQTPTPPSINPEVMARAARAKASASEEAGVNQMVQHGTKPAGLDSGAALREYKDSTTQRFALQEKAYEQFRADIVILLLSACKRLGSKAPEVTQRTRFGIRRIKWSKVDLKDLKVNIQMASGLPRTVAGRTQMVLEWAQAGLIPTDEARRLLRHPDVERSLSLFTAGVEALEHAFDLIADGEVVMPEPFMNLNACVSRGQNQYLEWWKIGAPEEVMEAIRQFVVQASDMLNPPAVNENVPAMDATGMPLPMQGGGDPTGGMGGAPAMAANANIPMAPVPAEPPQAALAAQAMNLRAV